MPQFGSKIDWFYTVTADFRSKSISATVFSLPLNVPDLQSPTAPGLRGVFKLASALHKISVFGVFRVFSILRFSVFTLAKFSFLIEFEILQRQFHGQNPYRYRE